MKYLAILLALPLSLALSSCAGGSKLARLEAPTTSVMKLEGTWKGKFENPQMNGNLKFVLTAGRATTEADGRVASFGSSRPLRFSKVQIEGSQFRAKGKTYLDKDCNCQVRTEFAGIISGDVISGTLIREKDGVTETAEATLTRE